MYGDRLQYYCSQVSAFLWVLVLIPCKHLQSGFIDWLIDCLIDKLNSNALLATQDYAYDKYAWVSYFKLLQQVFYNQVSMQYYYMVSYYFIWRLISL